jgi:hypothetical protein
MHTIESIKQLARTTRVDDAHGNKEAVPGAIINLMGGRAQVFCHYISGSGNGDSDEHHWYVNGVERDRAFVQRLLDAEEHPAMLGHGH